MKIIPKYTDLIAKAKKFEEATVLSENQSERHSYEFENGYSVVVVRWNKNFVDPYCDQVEALAFKNGRWENGTIVANDIELRSFLDGIEERTN